MNSPVHAFLHEDFLLRTKTARRLYHEHAAGAPIVDYHCHLDPGELAANRRFENIARLWVIADPYKHRAMRLAGVPERLITGDASDRQKFDAWAATVPQALGNPLYHWTALELSRYFGVDEPLTAETAGRIWEACNARLAEPSHAARGLLRQRKVRCVCTSDRLLDNLMPHARASAEPDLRVLPSLRNDDVTAIEGAAYDRWLGQLGDATGEAVRDFDALRNAVVRRLDEFTRAGCRLADHALDELSYVPTADDEAAGIFARRVRGEALSQSESVRLRSALLRFVGAEYARRGWIMQLHLGAQRCTSTRLRTLAGPAGGYAAIGARVDIASLSRWLDELEQAGALPRVIFYPLDPADFVPLAVLSGSFAQDGVAAKLQLGPAWWFNDHAHGMRQQLEAIANHALLGTFIGMTTDSRSLLSMVRHEYFRRVLCDWVGGKAEAGELPNDDAELGALIRRLCHGNAEQALNLTTS